jgi:formate dehydrogenase maturation protein FdhE
MKQIQNIFQREADRLDKLSQDNQLDADGLRRLVALTHAWKNYAGSPIADNQAALDHLSLEELQALANETPNDNQTKPGRDGGS